MKNRDYDLNYELYQTHKFYVVEKPNFYPLDSMLLKNQSYYPLDSMLLKNQSYYPLDSMLLKNQFLFLFFFKLNEIHLIFFKK